MSGRHYSETDMHLALDGEMPAEARAEFDRWLAENPAELARYERYKLDREMLKTALDPVLGEPLPPRLARFRQISRSGHRPAAPWRMAAAALLLVAAGAAAGYLVGIRSAAEGDGATFLADNAIAAHVIYAAEKRHTVEVGADEKDHLVAWLSKRVGVSLMAPNLETFGFTLIGGRLLPSGRQPAAQFMYENKSGERISLYVTNAERSDQTGFREVEEQGARAFYWRDQGYACAMTASASENGLLAMSRDAYRQLVSGDNR
ncbi:MAG: anti-sigma factor [Rhizobiaceae bacterium]